MSWMELEIPTYRLKLVDRAKCVLLTIFLKEYSLSIRIGRLGYAP